MNELEVLVLICILATMLISFIILIRDSKKQKNIATLIRIKELNRELLQLESSRARQLVRRNAEIARSSAFLTSIHQDLWYNDQDRAYNRTRAYLLEIIPQYVREL